MFACGGISNKIGCSSGLTHYNHFLLESILLQGGFHSASSSYARKSEFHPAIFLFIVMLSLRGLFWIILQLGHGYLGYQREILCGITFLSLIIFIKSDVQLPV